MDKKLKPSCVVIGAGVVGLSTALCLQDKGFDVTIIAERFGAHTTSHIAGGVFLPYNRDVLGYDRRSDAVEIVKRSWNHYTKVYNSSTQNTGVIKCFGYQCYFTNNYGEALPDSPLVWEVADKFRSLSVDELRKLSPESACTGWIIQTYAIQCQYYLPYLMNRFKDRGGRIIQQRVKSFSELGEGPQFDVLVNCCGIGAVELCGDKTVYPAQGQVAHIRAPHIKHFFHCEEVYQKKPEDRQLLYVLPQTDHVYIGGTYTEYSDTTLVSDGIRNAFIKKLSHVIPSIQNCEIIKEECGIRPSRNVIRLEGEELTLEGGKVVKVVHNYGHGGNGVALSWGTAELAADMAARVTTLRKSKL